LLLVNSSPVAHLLESDCLPHGQTTIYLCHLLLEYSACFDGRGMGGALWEEEGVRGLPPGNPQGRERRRETGEKWVWRDPLLPPPTSVMGESVEVKGDDGDALREALVCHHQETLPG
jgi:hypothetical protein